MPIEQGGSPSNPDPATDGTLEEILAAVGGGDAPVTPAEGRIVVAVTDTAIALGTGAFKTIWINGLTANSDVVVIGGSGVVHTSASRTGKILYSGDGITIANGRLQDWFINGVAGDGISFTYTT